MEGLQALPTLSELAVAATISHFQSNGSYTGFVRDSGAECRPTTGGLLVLRTLWELDTALSLADLFMDSGSTQRLLQQRSDATQWLLARAKSGTLAHDFGNSAFPGPSDALPLSHLHAIAEIIRQSGNPVDAEVLTKDIPLKSEQWQEPPIRDAAYIRRHFWLAIPPNARDGEKQRDYIRGALKSEMADAQLLPARADPAASCMDIETLLRLAESQSTEAVIPAYEALGSFVREVAIRTLRALNGEGSLPYGRPFAYSPTGVGAYAPSASALRALSWSLYRLAEIGRQKNYPGSITLLFEQLTSKECDIRVLLDSVARAYLDSLETVGSFRGWASDRAPKAGVTHSWATIEVLGFALCANLLVDELSMWRALRGMRAQRFTADAKRVPTWPDGSTEKGKLLDPDLGLEDSLVAWWCNHLLRPSETMESWKASETTSILMYGPPGTAKTTLARSSAKRMGWHYVELSPSEFVRDGYDHIESNASRIFDQCASMRQCVILFDEVDSLLISREMLQTGSYAAYLVPAMLPKLQRLSSMARGRQLLIILCTNFYERLDSAAIRPGRIHERLLVRPPNRRARKEWLTIRMDRWRALTVENQEKILDGTALYVFEEIESVIRTINGLADPNRGVTVAKLGRPSIVPELYKARIPTEHSRGKETLASIRLANEVGGIVGRLCEEGWQYTESRPELRQALERSAETVGRIGHPDSGGWHGLCAEVIAALSDRRV